MKKNLLSDNIKQNSIKNVKTLVTSGVLTAICLVLAFLAKSIFGTGPIRFTIENLPIMLGSFLYGPCVGALIAVAADLISCLISGMAPLPLITVGAAATGLVSGIIFKYLPVKFKGNFRIVISVISAHIVGSMIIKSVALFEFYGGIVFWRIPLYIAIAAIESFTIITLMNNSSFAKIFSENKVTKK